MSDFEKMLCEMADEILKEMKNAGMNPAGPIAEIRENRRAKRRLGCCRRTERDGRVVYIIEISNVLRGEKEPQIKEVLVHELLHTCRGCFDHGAEWKACAAKMNRLYGYHVTRTASDSMYGMQEKNVRYRITCSDCGNTMFRIRRSRVVREPEQYKCAGCGGKLTVTEL